jgi:sugar lactone lactonase YvrE
MTVGGEQVLAWVNIQTAQDSQWGYIHGHYMDSGALGLLLPCPERPGFLLPIAGGDRMLVGMGKSLRVGDLRQKTWTSSLATIPDDNPRTIINDAEIVPGGKAIVFGTKDTQFKDPIANLYLYTVDDHRVSLLTDQQTCSNGKVFQTAERGLILYDIDTPTRQVARYRLDVAARTATPDGIAIDLADQVGFPDGMCDCGDGTVIIAFYNPDFAEAGKAIRFRLATGEAIEEWTTPGSPRVTCPLLVHRPDGVTLVLTTATEGMPAEMRANCPNTGGLFVVGTTLATCPQAEFVRLRN